MEEAWNLATKKEYKIVHKSLKMSINNEAIAILWNAAKKVKTDKWIYHLILLFSAEIVSLEFIKIDN